MIQKMPQRHRQFRIVWTHPARSAGERSTLCPPHLANQPAPAPAASRRFSRPSAEAAPVMVGIVILAALAISATIIGLLAG